MKLLTIITAAAATLLATAGSGQAATLWSYSNGNMSGDVGGRVRADVTAWSLDGEDLCNSRFGDFMFVNACDAPETTTAKASASVDGKFFGHTFDVVDIEAGVAATESVTEGSLRLEVAGHKVLGFSFPLEVTWDHSFPVYFTGGEGSMKLYGIEVSGGAGLRGNLGVEVTATAGTSAMAVTATPYASVDLHAMVSAGAMGVTVGVEGNLELARFSVPSELTVSLPKSSTYTVPGVGEIVAPNVQSIDWTLEISRQIDALAGTIDLFVDTWGKTWPAFELCSFPGYTWNESVAAYDGTIWL